MKFRSLTNASTTSPLPHPSADQENFPSSPSSSSTSLSRTKAKTPNSNKMDKTTSFDSMEKEQNRNAHIASPLSSRDLNAAKMEVKRKEDKVKRKAEEEERFRKEKKAREDYKRKRREEEEEEQSRMQRKAYMQQENNKRINNNNYSNNNSYNNNNYSNKYSNNNNSNNQIEHPSASIYPKTSIPLPDLIEKAFNARPAFSSTGVKKHHVTIEDLIVSICDNENTELKKVQAKTQKYSDIEGKIGIERCRATVKDVQVKALLGLEQVRAANELHVSDLKRSNPINVSNWADVSSMMERLASLKAEEKGWALALRDVEDREAALRNGSVLKDEEDSYNDELEVERETSLSTSTSSTTSTKSIVDTAVNSAVSDITLQADRISQTLRGISQIVDESEVVKKGIYEVYTEGIMFQGYENVDDSKALVKGYLH